MMGPYMFKISADRLVKNIVTVFIGCCAITVLGAVIVLQSDDALQVLTHILDGPLSRFLVLPEHNII